MKIFRNLMCSFFVFLAPPALAYVQIGTGFNSATGGRLVPSVNLGIGGDSFVLLSSSTGVATSVYNHAAYSLSGYWIKKAGNFFWGDVVAGFGIGSFYESRTYKDIGSAEETQTDFAAGPAFFSKWNFLSPVYLSVEAVCGLGDPRSTSGQILGLSYRDHVNFILGVQL